MSCAIMYQPYAMYPSCDRPAAEKSKLFKFPHAPSPPDSLHSEASSYSSPGPSSGGAASSSSATSSSSASQSHSHSRSHNLSSSHSRRPLTPCSSTATLSGTSASVSHSRASATATSSHSQNNNNDDLSLEQSQSPGTVSAPSATVTHSETPGSSHSHRAHYLSANCVIHIQYNGDVNTAVNEHFSRALDRQSKCSSMIARNFPPSFWNSNHQQQLSKPLASYGAASAAEFYGAAAGVDYGAPIPSLAHHHQADPWHYPLSTHQSYHHRSTDIPYPSMASSSRFNAAQYGSFLLAGAAAGTGGGRFPGMPGSSQCGVGVKGDSGPWPGSRYHHESLSDLHLADYSAHYSNMTAGLEASVPESSKDLYWF